MRERTTWNRNEIRTKAANLRTAEDPRAMNQDHLSQQPAADDYVIGGPSEFAEDVHPSAGTWGAEMAGGGTRRNEIGMPEFRADTFKTAGLDDETVEKKANVCVRVAKWTLGPTASERDIEDHALNLMDLPDVNLIEMHNRLAAKKSEEVEEVEEEVEEDEEEEATSKEASRRRASKKGEEEVEEEEVTSKEASRRRASKKGEDEEASEEEEVTSKEASRRRASKKGEDEEASEEEEVTSKEASRRRASKKGEEKDEEKGEVPPEFKEQQEKKKAALAKKAFLAARQGSVEQFSAALGALVSTEVEKALAAKKPAGQNSAYSTSSCGPEMAGDDPMAAFGDPMMAGDDPMMAGDDLESYLMDDVDGIDPGMEDDMMFEDEIMLDSPTMDVGEVSFGPEDEVLTNLFAGNREVQAARQAQSIENGTAPARPGKPGVRTASTRTVGTRPSGGVSKIGSTGASADQSVGEVDKLSGLWNSAPDVSDHF